MMRKEIQVIKKDDQKIIYLITRHTFPVLKKFMKARDV